MKKGIFSIVLVFIVLTMIFSLACKSSEDIDVRGTWEITITGLNGDTTGTYHFEGSQAGGTVSGGTSNVGEGTYKVAGNNIEITYIPHLLGVDSYTFNGYFSDKKQMKGTGVALLVLAPEFDRQRDFQWQARRK